MNATRRAPIPFPAPQNLTGRSVGRFAVRYQLGAGGLGEVYYAEDTALRRPIALKRVAHDIGSNPKAREQILREAQRTSTLPTEHIAVVHDVIEEGGELFIVMEYVEGETLRQRLRGSMTLDDFFDIAVQCAEALIAAHERGIIHCDLKPENIMITPAGLVKILDFGLAKHLPRSDKSSTLESSVTGGTPSYMAPEVLLGKLPNTNTDIFSLGVVFYEMLTLKNPFLGSSFIATGERILHEQPASVRACNPQISQELETIVMKAIAKPAMQRYANARELLDDLRRVQRGRAPAKLLPAIASQKQWVQRRWFIAGVLLLAVAAAALAIVHWRPRQPILAERGWVLVADFDTSADGGVPGVAVREGLTIALQQSHYVNVFPRTRIYEVLRRMKKEDATRIDEPLGREICQRENLQLLLVGSIQRIGQVYQISVRALDPVQGSVLVVERERFDQRDQFFDKVDSLAKEIRADLGESLGGIERASRQLANVTTTSLEALHLYSQAEDAKDQGKDEQVEGLLVGALRLDPDFAMAHMRLGQYYSAVVGRNDRALAELDRAYQMRNGVSDREQRRIEAEFYDLQERYDEKAQSLHLLVSLYPDDEKGHSELAAAYYDLGQLDNAIQEARETLRLNPMSAPGYGGLVLYLARANHPDFAIDAAHEAEQRGVSSPRIHWGLGLAYLSQGNLLSARQEFEGIGRRTEIDQDLQDLCRVVADLYEGKLHAAKRQLAMQIEALPPESGGLQAFRRYLLGRIYLMEGNASEAERQADLMLRTPRTRLQGNDFLHAGTLYARGGMLAKARQVLHELGELQKEIPSSTNQDYFNSLKGEILLAQSNPQQAEISFSIHTRSYVPVIASTGLARVYQVERRWEMAVAQWERVLSETGQILQSGFPPDVVVAHLELAYAYRQMNRPNLARRHYEEALRMWEHADELNLLRDAKREYHELGA